VDGYCCNSDCAMSCQACDVSDHLGTCTNVTGAPHGSRTCNGSGTCGGSCSGSSQSCTYPSSQVICGAACDGTCNGNGGCSSVGSGSCPNGFACGTNMCKTSCSVDQDCQAPNFKCTSSPNCVRIPESDCLDGVDNNGDGLIDCADPTCINSRVVCTPSSLGPLGVVSGSDCSTGFTPTQINQVLMCQALAAAAAAP
jgi:hypothetical protein